MNTYVKMTENGQYLRLKMNTSFNTGPDLYAVSDLNNASVFTHKPNELSNKDKKWFDSCITVEAYEIRVVKLGVPK